MRLTSLPSGLRTAAVLLALAASPADAADLRVGLAAPVTSIDPHFANTSPNFGFARHVYEMLVDRGPDGRAAPSLAVSWRTLSDLQWEFKLRPGVVWHDGTPFTADDVVFSFARAPDVPNSPAGYGGYLRSVQRIEVLDPLTVRIHTAEPAPNLPIDLSAIAVVSRHAGEGAGTADYNAGKAAIGTGPFRFAGFTPGVSVQLARNEAWWGGAVPWEHVTLQNLPNPSARTAALLAGDVDIIAAPAASDLPRLRGEPAVAIAERQGTRLLYMSPDFSRTGDTPFVTANDGTRLGRNPLLDLRVRQALSLAISRDGLATRVLGGMAEPTGQWLPAGSFGYNPGIAAPAQDLVRARQLLAEAGYPQGFRMVLNASNDRYPADAAVAQAVAQMWTRAGVATTVEVQPFAIYLARAARQEFSMVQESWGSSSGEAGSVLLNVVHSFDGKRRGASNDTRYSNPALDGRIDQALATVDDAAREARLRALVKDTMDEEVIIPLFLYRNAWAVRRPLSYVPRADELTLAIDVRPAPEAGSR